MFRLNPISEPTWVDVLPGVRLRVDPVGAVIIACAQDDAVMKALPEGASASTRFAALAVSVARLAVTDWAGVGDMDGQPLDCTPDGVGSLLQNWTANQAFQSKVLVPAFALVAEKKD